MNEAKITGELRQHLTKLGGVWVKHADRATIGVPDCSFTFNKITLWMEIKLISLGREQVGVPAKEIVESSTHGRLQLHGMRQLAIHGHAAYVVFARRGQTWWTLLLHPEQLHAAYVASDDRVKYFYLGPFSEGKRFERIENLIKEARRI